MTAQPPRLRTGLTHALEFSVPSPWIARCSRCGRLLKGLADVAAPCPGPLPAPEVSREAAP